MTLLGLLDMSAAFDCIDHSLLLQRLEKTFGLTGVVLRWLESFLSDRTQEVFYNGELSAVQRIYHGVPQGSVLGPLLFNLYTADVNLVVTHHGLQFHQYADDCQVYVSAPVDEASTTIARLSRCVTDVESWLSASRLRLNPAKTVLIWLGSRQQVDKISDHEVPILSSAITTVDTARDLGVVLDSHLTMSAHVSSVCWSAYCFLRQLRPVARSLSVDAAKTVVHAFISSHLDYCNSLVYGITDNLLRRLQSVQNAAARLVTGTRRCGHITPVLRQLHWLPLRQRVEFKLAVLMFKALNDLAPQYLSDDCQLVAASGCRHHLRSSQSFKCSITSTSTRLGDRAFSAAGPRIWNSLPAQVRQPDLTLNSFYSKLKTYLFVRDTSA